MNLFSLQISCSVLHKKAEKIGCLLLDKGKLNTGDHVALLFPPGKTNFARLLSLLSLFTPLLNQFSQIRSLVGFKSISDVKLARFNALKDRNVNQYLLNFVSRHRFGSRLLRLSLRRRRSSPHQTTSSTKSDHYPAHCQVRISFCISIINNNNRVARVY